MDVPDAASATSQFKSMRAHIQATHESGRAGALCLALGIGFAFVAPQLGLAWLMRVAVAAIGLSTLLHCRAAWLETRFAIASRACLSNRMDCALPRERAWLRDFGRMRTTAAAFAWVCAGLVSLLVFPLTLAYETPAILKIYGLVLALSAVRLPYIAMLNRRFLRELGERSRDVAGPDVIAM